MKRARKKHHVRLSRLALALLCIAIIGCASTPTIEPVEITILHLADLHARLTPDENGLGGFAQVASALDREQAAARWSLTVHAGDLVQGSPVSTLFRGLPIFEIADHLGIDVNCLGNHEFDYGWQSIEELLDRESFETVCANVMDEANSLIAPAYVIRDVGPLRIGVVGVMTEKLLDLTTTEQLGPYRARPIVETLRPLLADLKPRTDMIVVLAHVLDEETRSILESLPDVNVVVQGHGHIAWDEPMQVDGRLGVTSDGYGRSLGRLELRYDSDSRRILSHEWENVTIRAADEVANPTVEELVAIWEAKVSEIVDVRIGEAKIALDIEEVRGLMERALLETTGADLAYLNIGGIRDILPRGDLLARHIWNVMPFDNSVVVVEIEGRQLLGLLDPTSGNRSVVEDRKIESDTTYRLATSDYLVGTWRDRGLHMKASDENILLRDLFIRWISERELIP